MSTIRVTNIEHGSTTDGGIQLDNAGHVTVDGQQMPTAGALSNRNLIINGAMQVAQRGTSSSEFNSYGTVDRFRLKKVLMDNLAGTQQQSTTAPAGFSNSFKIDITTAESALAADEFFSVRHAVEAQNLQHLEYNTSGAKAVTLSFWVRSHVTGTYSVGITNNDPNRNIAKTYSISSADTWEYKTVTFPGDTAGANPNNDNGIGFLFDFYLAAGSNFTSSDGSSWGAFAENRRAYGHTANAVGTTGGFYITGVQLEVGEKATPFEHRSYGDELQRCYRYYYKIDQINGAMFGVAVQYSATKALGLVSFPVPMRANITAIEQSGTASDYGVIGSQTTVNCTAVPSYGGDASNTLLNVNFTVSSGSFSTGEAVLLRSRDNDAFLAFSAEL